MAMLCLNFGINAQETQEIITPLKVGQRLSDAFWTQKHTIYANGKINTKSLSSYRNKLLVLDFWASWCTSCRKKFPDLKLLQEKYKGQLSILLVNSKRTQDKNETLIGILNGTIAPYKEYKLPSILEDEVLYLLFPHKLIPHYVWIIDDQIRGITTTEFVNSDVIEQLLDRSSKLQKFND